MAGLVGADSPETPLFAERFEMALDGLVRHPQHPRRPWWTLRFLVGTPLAERMQPDDASAQLDRSTARPNNVKLVVNGIRSPGCARSF